eukprot:scaffold55253_cov61-Phaeocystis_antarctica.AAC.6
MVAVLILSPFRIDARRLDRFKELDAFVKKPLGAPYDSSERRHARERAGRKGIRVSFAAELVDAHATTRILLLHPKHQPRGEEGAVGTRRVCAAGSERPRRQAWREENLMRHGHTLRLTVSPHEGRARSEVGTGALPHEHHTLSVGTRGDNGLRRWVGEPRQHIVHVLHRRRERMLRCEPIVDAEHAPVELAAQARAQRVVWLCHRVAETPAAAVDVDDERRKLLIALQDSWCEEARAVEMAIGHGNPNILPQHLAACDRWDDGYASLICFAIERLHFCRQTAAF